MLLKKKGHIKPSGSESFQSVWSVVSDPQVTPKLQLQEKGNWRGKRPLIGRFRKNRPSEPDSVMGRGGVFIWESERAGNKRKDVKRSGLG